MKKLMKYFGYVPSSEYSNILNNYTDILNKYIEISKKDLSFFGRPEIRLGIGSNDVPWKVMWDKEYRPLYDTWYIRTISTDPIIIQNLLYAIGEFDFNKVKDYMTKAEWFWSDEKESPSISDMVSTVLELAHLSFSDYDGTKNSSSSGGFEVTITEEKNIIITFNGNIL